MKPVSFPQQNVVFAKDQPEYLPLPAYVDGVQAISRWKLSLWERVMVLLTGKIWLRQLNFGKSLQPQLPQTKSPFPKHKTAL